MHHHVGNKISLHPPHGMCAAWVLLRYKMKRHLSNEVIGAIATHITICDDSKER
jgi:hypothetical protein